GLADAVLDQPGAGGARQRLLPAHRGARFRPRAGDERRAQLPRHGDRARGALAPPARADRRLMAAQPHALIVLAHPEPKSFNAQLARAAQQRLMRDGWSVEVSDLCAQGFEPNEAPHHYAARRDPAWFRPQDEQRYAAEGGSGPAARQAEIDKLDRADLLLVQYPMWWYQPPAILKGWLDRVLTYGG